MTDNDHLATDLSEALVPACLKLGVPGAILGLSVGGRRSVVWHGTTSTRTGVDVTRDTVFQIGSITKVYVATMAMVLVGRGVLDLDTPLRQYLPSLRLSTDELTGSVTLRRTPADSTATISQTLAPTTTISSATSMRLHRRSRRSTVLVQRGRTRTASSRSSAGWSSW